MARQFNSLEIDEANVENGVHLGSQSQNSFFERLRGVRFLPAWLGGSNESRLRSSEFFHRLPTSDNTFTFSDEDPDTEINAYRHPYREYPSQKWIPEEEASWISHALFLWVGGLLNLGTQKSLEHDDLWDIAPGDEASRVSALFQNQLQATEDDFDDFNGAPKQGRVGKAMWKMHRRRFILAGVVKLIHDAIMFTGPFLLEVLLKHVQSGGGGWTGFGYACALALAAVLETLTINVYFHTLFRICLHLKTELVDMLYAKSLRVSAAAKSEMGAGAVVNLQSNDAAKLWSLPQYLHMLWSGPVQIIAVMALLVRIIHFIPALVGLAVTVALIPLSALVAKALAKVRRKIVALTDARVKLCSEVITGIKAIKLYAWETPYKERILALREKELAEIRKSALIGTWNNILWQGGPILISMAAFLSYTAMGYPLTAAVAFPALSLFNLLRFPVMMFPTQLMNIVNAKVALDRIQKFIEAEEMMQPPLLPAAKICSQINNGGTAGGTTTTATTTSTNTLSTTTGRKEDFSSVAVAIRGSPSFAWTPTYPPLLHDINFEIQAGQLVIVVGSVGSGKSSLLAALLGEMCMVKNNNRIVGGGGGGGIGHGGTTRGSVMVAGTVAYTQQDPWIQNASLKNNILMGMDTLHSSSTATSFSQSTSSSTSPAQSTSRYHKVLEACALLPDIDMLPAGDATEIGEKGVNLSGGQRHRVALARACYADADVYLLDDPISAVDAHVGRHLFDICLCGLLRNKTRILVTHQLQYLGAADVVMVLKDGRVAEMGSYRELIEKGVDFHQFELAAVKKNGGDNKEAEEEGGGGGEELLSGVETVENIERKVENKRSAALVVDEEEESDVLARHDILRDSAAELDTPGGASGSSSSTSENTSPLPKNKAIRDIEHERQQQLVEVPLDSPSASSSTPPSPSYAEVCGSAETGGVVQINYSSHRQTQEQQQQEEEGKKLLKKPGSQARLSKAAAAQLTKAEERAVGRVERQVYMRYFSAYGPALIIPAIVLALAVIERGLQAGQNWWLSVWTEATATAQATSQAADTTYYMKVYFIIGIISLVFQVSRAVILVLGSISAARRLQASLLSTVLRLPMSFFDSQPTGRLLNRFTKDTESVDTSIQSSVASFLNCAVSVLWSLVVVIAVSPGVAVALIPLGWAYSAVQKRYIATSRELKRLDSLALSPIFSHFGETLAGLTTLRAFRAQQRFAARDAALLNESNRCYWPAQCVNRWLSVRLELLGIAVVFGTAVFVSSVVPTSAGLAGLALTSALNLTGLMNWMVRQTTELEVNMNSVERMIEYDSQPPEAPEIVPFRRPLPDWPSRGAISVQSLVVRYRPELDPVLKGITFQVKPKEKIGVVGRTGCGKSTLMLALYRIIEPTEGRIIIDNIDVATIGLRDLRSRLALVPQDPVIFSGTVRSNLDPFGDAGRGLPVSERDAPLWSSLERAGLASAIRALPGQLDTPISEGGGNLSAGQRQLLCMARALLRSAQILILDEATSSIDTASDTAVQTTISSAFSECTVLTIAHRLHTIITSDRILVLDAGEVLEFDSPTELMKQQGGAFKALVDQTNSNNTNRNSGGGGGGVEARKAALLAAVSAPLDKHK
ncbi:putative ABC transporter C family member 10 [Nannochloris sp. 'desiccata']|nr:putative ABC transporter C family member 10 [Chlorella desiccata (nom. nud.)]